MDLRAAEYEDRREQPTGATLSCAALANCGQAIATTMSISRRIAVLARRNRDLPQHRPHPTGEFASLSVSTTTNRRNIIDLTLT
jgi:hypothetical protein